jgi:hypothetical protein
MEWLYVNQMRHSQQNSHTEVHSHFLVRLKMDKKDFEGVTSMAAEEDLREARMSR